MMDSRSTCPRVLLLTSHPVGGHDGADTDFALALANGLTGYKVISFRQKWPGTAGSPAQGTHIPMLSKAGRPGITEKLQAAAWSIALASRVDLTHAIYSIGSLFPAHVAADRWLPHFRRGPVIHTIPGIVDHSALRRSDGLGTTVALSEYTAEILRTSGLSNVRVIPPGVDLDRWRVTPKPTGQVPRLLFAGHYGAGAGAMRVIDIAAAVRATGQSISLTMAMRGHRKHRDGREMELLRSYARRAGVSDVTIRGRVPDMRTLLAEATILVHPPIAHAGTSDIPLVVLQAMASGRPAVVSALPGIADLADGVVRTAPGDVASARDAVVRLLDDPGWWVEIAARARCRVLERYSAELMVRRYEDLYEEVVE